jgi:glycerol-3-phosphate dehydrogenase
MKREVLIDELRIRKDIVWDTIILGGGATGLGIALDGASRGYKVLLLEQSDFAKGTSSRSTKLVHGGVRYLARGDILLVMEALHERGLMLKNAPHLTFNQDFIIPVYTFWDVVLYSVGLKFYDLLAGKLSMGRSYFISKKQTLSRLPLLKSDGLKGGIVYHDGQFDDSRMAISLAKTCVDHGGIVLNYFKVLDLVKNDQGSISGVIARNVISEENFRINARLVINATGVFADDIVKLDNPAAKATLKPSQGVHIVLDSSFLQSSSAIMIPKTNDGRVLFAIPWYGKVVVGTTDTPIDSISQEPRALEQEIDFILQTAGSYLVKAPQREDILSIFAGLRPLAANPDNPESTREVSRRHKIILSPSGLLTIIGGKWTTYRRMALETIDRAIKYGYLPKRKCLTANLKLTYLTNSELSNRLHIYGEGMKEIQKLIGENPEMGRVIDIRLPYTKAEIVWICRNEMPVNVEDVLSRRTRALLLDAKTSLEIASDVADIMALEMGHDLYWKQKQLEQYQQLVENYY